MNYANPKNLRRGDLITPITKNEREREVLQGDRLRVLSVALPFIYVESYSYCGNKFTPTCWNVNADKSHIIRLHKNAVTPLCEIPV